MAPVRAHHVQGGTWVPGCGEAVSTAGYVDGPRRCGAGALHIPRLLYKGGYDHFGAPSTASPSGGFYVPLEDRAYAAPLAVRVLGAGRRIEVGVLRHAGQRGECTPRH